MGTCHPVRNTPHIAIAVAAVPMIAIPIATTLFNEAAVNATGWVGTVATFGSMLGYALVGIGGPIFLRRAGVPASLAWVLGLLGATMMVFVFSGPTGCRRPSGQRVPLSHGAYVSPPYIFLAWTAIGIVYYAIGSGAIPRRRLRSGTATTRQKKKPSPWPRGSGLRRVHPPLLSPLSFSRAN